MKRIGAILFLVGLFQIAAISYAQYFPMTTETDMLLDSSSYGTPNYVLWERYVAGYFDGMNQGVTNHIFDVSQSGSALQFDWQGNWPKWALPHMWHFAKPFSVLVMPNDNGGYGYSDVLQWETNMLASPPIFWNGTASTNHELSFQAMSFYPLSGIPGSSGDYSAPLAWEHASTNVSALALTTPVPLVTLLLQSKGFTNFTYYSGSHPTPPQHLEMAVTILKALNVETNVGTLTFDWGAAVAYTNHWAASGISVSGNTLTATVRPTRLPPGFDVPDGYITNDCRGAFTNIPTLGDSFRWILQVTNLPSGTYTVAYNGSNVVQLTDTQLSSGWNQWTNYNGVYWNTMKGIQTNICVEYGIDPVTLSNYHDAGSGGLHGVYDLINWQSQGTAFYDAGNITGFLSNMGTAITGMDVNAAFTSIASAPPTATLTITLQPSIAAAPFRPLQ